MNIRNKVAVILSQRQFIKINKAVLEVWPNRGACAMLFYPGTMLAPGHYQLFLFCLFRAGFTVGALHFEGHGKGVASNNFTYSSLLAQGLAAEDWLREHYDNVVVSGHSQGGIMAMTHASKSCRLNAAFAICAIFPQMEEAIRLTLFAPLKKQKDKLLKFIRCLGRIFPVLPIPLPFYLSCRKLMAGRRKPLIMGKEKGRLTYPVGYLSSLFDATIDQKLNCPFWLFSAKNDALFERDLIIKTFQHIEAPVKKLVWLEDGGHLAPLNPCLASFIACKMSEICAGLGLQLNLIKFE